jgi:serine protease Do
MSVHRAARADGHPQCRALGVRRTRHGAPGRGGGERGIVSGVDRQIPGSAAQGRALVDLIQVDAPISPGNSGGALFDGTATHPYLGVSLGRLTPQIRDRLGVTAQQGALIVGIAPGGPAATTARGSGQITPTVTIGSITG